MTPDKQHKPYLKSLTIKGVDPDLRRWFKARAALENSQTGVLLNEIIRRYMDEVGWSQPSPTTTPNPHPTLTVRGLDPALWQWVKARATHEDKVVGDIINNLIRLYKDDTSLPQINLPPIPPVSDPNHIVSIPGIDRSLWRHLKDGAALEQKTVGEALNEILSWYRRTVNWP